MTAQCDDYTPIDVATIVHEWTCEVQNQKAVSVQTLSKANLLGTMELTNGV